MTKVFGLLCVMGLLLGSSLPLGAAGITREYSVQVSATVQEESLQITLHWPQDSSFTPQRYSIYRRQPQDRSWGEPLAILSGTTTNFVDRDIQIGTVYEYQVHKVTPHYNGYGYVLSGIQAPMIDQRGKLILVVDDTFSTDLALELERLELDLIGDGWKVVRQNVRRSESVRTVKSVIQNEYNKDPLNVKAVFLFGHVPVPYSGDIVPDGHTPHHFGSWPADAYYGDMDGTWTDHHVNNTRASDPMNRNVPGDGKFDQSDIPSEVELQVGRVDLANMPGRKGGRSTFPSELELLRQYLNKDHKFRHGLMPLQRRAIVHDSFGLRNGEAFAASGYRNFAPFFGAENIVTLSSKGEWLPSLKTNSYLFAYGCGSGSYTSIAGLGAVGSYMDGTTTDIVEHDIQSAFLLLFGSWLGDWDSEDNILRSVLATPNYGLTAAWSGRPHWYMHHMALGQNIGFSARLTQNNSRQGNYRTERNSAAGQIHIALMGDPTLRMHTVLPPSKVQAFPEQGQLTVNWQPSPDNVVGYHVYRAAADKKSFVRLTKTPVKKCEFVDAASDRNGTVYMVRALKLEQSASGTYFNPSQGIFSKQAANPALEFTSLETEKATGP